MERIAGGARCCNKDDTQLDNAAAALAALNNSAAVDGVRSQIKWVAVRVVGVFRSRLCLGMFSRLIRAVPGRGGELDACVIADEAVLSNVSSSVATLHRTVQCQRDAAVTAGGDLSTSVGVDQHQCNAAEPTGQ